MITVTSSNSNPVQPIGSAEITLTCSIRISPAIVGAFVAINIIWNGPSGFRRMIPVAQIIDGPESYDGREVIRSFGRNESGVYNCTATVNSASPFLAIDSVSQSGTARVTVGEKYSCDIINSKNITIHSIIAGSGSMCLYPFLLQVSTSLSRV